MCLGVPGLLVERDGDPEVPSGLVEFAGIRRRICLLCTPDALPGDYVIVHAGVAISKLDATEAERILWHLKQIEETDEWQASPDIAGGGDALRR